MAETNDEDKHYRYKFGMRVSHPSLDLNNFLQPLEITPDNNRIAGDVRVAPNGQMLPGKYRESFWNWSRLVKGERRFTKSISCLLETLEEHGTLLRSVTDSGGSVAVALKLPGIMNIGSSLSFKEMARLANLMINLDLEIFPDPDNFK